MCVFTLQYSSNASETDSECDCWGNWTFLRNCDIHVNMYVCMYVSINVSVCMYVVLVYTTLWKALDSQANVRQWPSSGERPSITIIIIIIIIISMGSHCTVCIQQQQQQQHQMQQQPNNNTQHNERNTSNTTLFSALPSVALTLKTKHNKKQWNERKNHLQQYNILNVAVVVLVVVVVVCCCWWWRWQCWWCWWRSRCMLKQWLYGWMEYWLTEWMNALLACLLAWQMLSLLPAAAAVGWMDRWMDMACCISQSLLLHAVSLIGVCATVLRPSVWKTKFYKNCLHQTPTTETASQQQPGKQPLKAESFHKAQTSSSSSS